MERLQILERDGELVGFVQAALQQRRRLVGLIQLVAQDQRRRVQRAGADRRILLHLRELVQQLDRGLPASLRRVQVQQLVQRRAPPRFEVQRGAVARLGALRIGQPLRVGVADLLLDGRLLLRLGDRGRAPAVPRPRPPSHPSPRTPPPARPAPGGMSDRSPSLPVSGERALRVPELEVAGPDLHRDLGGLRRWQRLPLVAEDRFVQRQRVFPLPPLHAQVAVLVQHGQRFLAGFVRARQRVQRLVHLALVSLAQLDARLGQLHLQRDQPIVLARLEPVDDDVQQLLDVGPAPARRIDLGQAFRRRRVIGWRPARARRARRPALP